MLISELQVPEDIVRKARLGSAIEHPLPVAIWLEEIMTDLSRSRWIPLVLCDENAINLDRSPVGCVPRWSRILSGVR